MAKDWIKLWKNLRTNRRYMALTPAERSGYLALLIEADNFGNTFETEAQLKFAMNTDYRYVAAIRGVGLLVGLTVYRAAEKQGLADPTAAERQRRFRERNGVTGRTITPKSQRNERDPEETREEEKRIPPSPPRGEAAKAAGERDRVKAHLVSRGYEADHPNAELICVGWGWASTTVILAVDKAIDKYSAKRPLAYIKREIDGGSSLLKDAKVEVEMVAHEARKAEDNHPRSLSVAAQ